MQIKIYAFEIYPGDGITFAQFFDFLELHSKDQIDEDYFLSVSEKDGWLIGLLLRPKDAGRFCKFKKSGESFKVTTEELEEGTNIADFNFFIINRTTGRGLYQYYHRSTAVRNFLYILRQRWKILKEQTIEARYGSLAKKTKAGLKRIRRDLRRLLDSSIIYRAESFEARVAHMARITSFSYTVATTAERVSGIGRITAPYVPRLRADVKAVNMSVTFHNNANMTHVKDLITRISLKNPESAHVWGEDVNGDDLDHKLFNDADIFEQYDFDTAVENLTIDSDDLNSTIQSAGIIARLIQIANRPDVKTILDVTPSRP